MFPLQHIYDTKREGGYGKSGKQASRVQQSECIGVYSMKFEKLSLDPTSIQGKKKHLTAEYKARIKPQVNAAIEEIQSKVYIRNHTKNPNNICAVTSNGGVSKLFTNKEDLARYIFDTYGEGWYDEVRLIDIDGQPTQRTRVQTGNFTDLKNYDYLGRRIIDSQECQIFSANADGSCCYHAYCAMIHHDIDIIDAKFAKTLLADLYGNCTNRTLQTAFESLLAVRFIDHYNEIHKSGLWGKQTELYALATIYKIIITSDNRHSLKMLPSLKMHQTDN